MHLRRRALRIVWTSVTFGLASLGCVSAAADDTPKTQSTPGETAMAKKATPPVDARVAAGWQQVLQEQLAQSQAGEALGLFSHGGWSNSGQVLVLLSQDGKVRDVMTVPANRTNKDALSAKRVLSDAELKDVQAALARLSKLADVDIEAFDALELEIVHLAKDPKGVISTVKRVYVRDPTDSPHPEHAAVIGALERLKKKGG